MRIVVQRAALPHAPRGPGASASQLPAKLQLPAGALSSGMLYALHGKPRCGFRSGVLAKGLERREVEKRIYGVKGAAHGFRCLSCL